MINVDAIIEKIKDMEPSQLESIFCSALDQAGITYEKKTGGTIIFDSLLKNTADDSSVQFASGSLQFSQNEKNKSEYSGEPGKSRGAVSISLRRGAYNQYTATELLLTA